MNPPRWTKRLLAVALSMSLAACSEGGGVLEPAGPAAASRPGGDSLAADSGTPPAPGASPGVPSQADVLPSEAELARARTDVGKLDVTRLAAQLIVPRQEGTGAAAADVVRRLHVGGVAAFGNVVPSHPERVRSQLSASNRAVQEAIRADGRGWPAFLAVDQEGGPVNRIGAPLTRFPAPMALGAARIPELTTQVGLISGSELRQLGFTVVLAPSGDVTAGAQDPTIGTRSPGGDPVAVTTVAGALLAGYREAGILATLKHFPGHGGVRADSHLGIARQPASLEALRARDLRPFAELASAAPAVMVGHIQLSAVDAKLPSTLSKAVITGLLRTEQQFTGLVVSDALEMQAITDGYGAGEAAVRAVEAGCDVLLIPADTNAAIEALSAAVRSGRLSRERLEESAARMVAALRHAQASAPRAVSTGVARATVQTLARASITQLDGGCGRPMVRGGITIASGDAADRAALTAAARAAGLTVGSGTVVRLVGGDGYGAAERAVGARVADAVEGGSPAPGAVGPREITVALDRPYVLASGRSGAVLIATYGRTPETFAALVDVLLGRHKAGGRLPVQVGRYAIGAGCR